MCQYSYHQVSKSSFLTSSGPVFKYQVILSRAAVGKELNTGRLSKISKQVIQAEKIVKKDN